MSATYCAEQVAELAGVSAWSVRQAAHRGDTPIGRLALRVGRRLIWPKASVDRLFDLDTNDPRGDGALPAGLHVLPPGGSDAVA